MKTKGLRRVGIILFAGLLACLAMLMFSTNNSYADEGNEYEGVPIVYHADGADTGQCPDSQFKFYNSDISIYGNVGNLQKQDYGFAGWNSKWDGSGDHYDEGSMYTENLPLDLYPEWTELHTITGTITLNDPTPSPYKIYIDLMKNNDDILGHFEYKDIHTQSFQYKIATIYHSNIKLRVYGDVVECKSDVFSFDKIITKDINAEILYSIKYDANGADSGKVPDIGYKEYCQFFCISCNVGSLRKSGFVFVGWNTQADGKGRHYDENASYPEDHNLVLYAEWKRGELIIPAGCPSCSKNFSVYGNYLGEYHAFDLSNNDYGKIIFRSNNKVKIKKIVLNGSFADPEAQADVHFKVTDGNVSWDDFSLTIDNVKSNETHLSTYCDDGCYACFVYSIKIFYDDNN